MRDASGAWNPRLTREQVEEAPEHSGSFRESAMSMQVWIAILVGLAAVIDDLARRQIANWIPVAALAGGFGWQIGQSGWRGAAHALRDGGGLCGLPDFLSAGRNGRRRREADGGLRRVAGRRAAARSRAVDRGSRRNYGGGGFGLESAAARSGRAERRRASTERGRAGAGRIDSLRAGDRAGVWLSLVPKG